MASRSFPSRARPDAAPQGHPNAARVAIDVTTLAAFASSANPSARLAGIFVVASTAASTTTANVSASQSFAS